MTYRTLLDQLTQISGSGTYDDTKSMADAENSEINRLEDDLNYLRTQLKLVTGETNWYDAPDNDIASLESDVNTLQTIGTAVKTFTGMDADDDSTPDYHSTNIVTGSLEYAISELDDVLNAVSGAVGEVDTLDSVVERGNVTDQPIFVTGLGVTGSIELTGDIDGVDLSGWNSAVKTFTGMDADDDSTPSYSSTIYVTNGDSLETAIGKLDAAIVDVDIVKEVERVTSPITSGSAHTIPNGKSYTVAAGANMDLYFNGQLLQANVGEVRDYEETSSTTVKFAFTVPPHSYLTYIIRK